MAAGLVLASGLAGCLADYRLDRDAGALDVVRTDGTPQGDGRPFDGRADVAPPFDAPDGADVAGDIIPPADVAMDATDAPTDVTDVDDAQGSSDDGVCAPNCGTRRCGDDSCGNVNACGTCAAGVTCTAEGTCPCPACPAIACRNTVASCASNGSLICVDMGGTSTGPCGAGGTCNGGVCDPGNTYPSCAAILAADPTAASGAYLIYPGGSINGVRAVYCDMTTAGDGWTVVSINGDRNSNACVHVLSASAPECPVPAGPTLFEDWQLDGPSVNLLPFNSLLFAAYDDNGAVRAGTVFVPADAAAGATHTVADLDAQTLSGALTAASPLPAIDCNNTPSATGRVSHSAGGFTVFGPGDSSCGAPSLVRAAIGLAAAGFGGWTSPMNTTSPGCQCTNVLPTTPISASTSRGYIGLR